MSFAYPKTADAAAPRPGAAAFVLGGAALLLVGAMVWVRARPAPSSQNVEVPVPVSLPSVPSLNVDRIPLPTGFSHFSARHGSVDSIVLHFTDGANDDPRRTIETWGERKASAHYINPRKGRLVAFIPEEMAAWHCPGMNDRGIGIENMATLGELLQGDQEQRLIALCRDIMERHKIVRISGHRFCSSHGTGSTNCPGTLFGAGADASVEAQREALRGWVAGRFGAELAAHV